VTSLVWGELLAYNPVELLKQALGGLHGKLAQGRQRLIGQIVVEHLSQKSELFAGAFKVVADGVDQVSGVNARM
jgi:hypothetical protein